jgi:hypothetical protein
MYTDIIGTEVWMYLDVLYYLGMVTCDEDNGKKKSII